eukprot:2511171-Rhodomonas_salina.3
MCRSFLRAFPQCRVPRAHNCRYCWYWPRPVGHHVEAHCQALIERRGNASELIAEPLCAIPPGACPHNRLYRCDVESGAALRSILCDAIEIAATLNKTVLESLPDLCRKMFENRIWENRACAQKSVSSHVPEPAHSSMVPPFAHQHWRKNRVVELSSSFAELLLEFDFRGSRFRFSSFFFLSSRSPPFRFPGLSSTGRVSMVTRCLADAPKNSTKKKMKSTSAPITAWRKLSPPRLSLIDGSKAPSAHSPLASSCPPT